MSKLNPEHTLTGKQFPNVQNRKFDDQPKYMRRIKTYWPERKGIIDKDYIETVLEMPREDMTKPVNQIY